MCWLGTVAAQPRVAFVVSSGPGENFRLELPATVLSFRFSFVKWPEGINPGTAVQLQAAMRNRIRREPWNGRCPRPGAQTDTAAISDDSLQGTKQRETSVHGNSHLKWKTTSDFPRPLLVRTRFAGGLTRHR